jgi:hypothetical protein
MLTLSANEPRLVPVRSQKGLRAGGGCGAYRQAHPILRPEAQEIDTAAAVGTNLATISELHHAVRSVVVPYE